MYGPLFVQLTKMDEDSAVRNPEFKFQFCPKLIFLFLLFKIQSDDNQ